MSSNHPPMPVSRAAGTIAQALSIYFNQVVYDLKRRGEDVITLSLGEAFFDIPLFDFRKLDASKGYHYSDSQGIPELRRKIADYYARYYGADVDADDEIIITAGSKVAIFMAMQAILDPGDEVLIHEPAWLSYQEQARLVGAVPRFIPYDADIADFGRYITPRTRLLIINNPNNPAGRLYTWDELKAIYGTCRPRAVHLMVDEAYSDFVIDEKFHSAAMLAEGNDGVIVVNSLSKNMGISGWRIGYVISSKDFVQTLLKINQHIITCAPSILLYYVNKYFDDIIAVTLPQVRQVVEKRQRVAEMIGSLGLSCLDGSTTFYFFISIGNFPGSSQDFALHLLLEEGISVVPGSAYGKSTERFIRLSIGTESDERIYHALQVVRDLTQVNTFDPGPLLSRLEGLGFQPFQAVLHEEC